VEVRDVPAGGAEVEVEAQEGANWIVRAVQVRGAEVLATAALPEGAARGTLTLVSPEPGAAWWVVLSPVDAAPGAWTWRLEARPVEADEVVDDCACDDARGAPVAVVLLALAVARRRRPSTVDVCGAS
jgi:hypothetical protein